MPTQQTLHLHMISDAADDALADIALAVRSQHKHVRTVEHVHSGVRRRYQLETALAEVKAKRGIVLYSFYDPELASILKKACGELNVPCLTARSPASSSRAALPQAKSARKFRAIALIGVGLFLLWEVGTRGLGAYFAETKPEVALLLPHTDAPALVKLAQNTLAPVGDGDDGNGGEAERAAAATSRNLDEKEAANLGSDDGNDDPQERPKLEAWLEDALRAEPLNAKAFLLLGQAKYSAKDPLPTDRLMLAATRRSLHQSNATYWVIRNGFEDGDYRKAIYYGDVLLRDRPQAVNEVMPILGRIAETPDGREQLAEVLATNPPWREAFFQLLPKYIKDARTPLNMALSLRNSPRPVDEAELTNYLTFLVDKGFEDLAYYAWLQFLPAAELSKVGRLINGNFQNESSGLIFDWVIEEGSNVTVERAERFGADEDYALRLDFGAGRVKDLSVSQLVMLPPGTYKFEGEYLSESKSTRGLRWRISCQKDKGKSLGESAPVVKLSDGEWKQFGFSFSVPKTKCAAQRVELLFDARWASERFISGSIWYDNLDIKPILTSL